MSNFLVKYIPLLGMVVVTHVITRDPKIQTILDRWMYCPGIPAVPEKLKPDNLFQGLDTHGIKKPINIITDERRKGC
jgi:hypothetical protein